MDFENRIKGYITETLIEGILTDAGYRVLRIGLEKQVLDRLLIDTAPDDFVTVPRAIRTMPDFLVLGDDSPRLVEIKYRSEWESSRARLGEKIAPQLELFPNTVVVVCCGRPPEGRSNGRAMDHLKVIRPSLDAQGRVCHTSKQQGCRPLAETPWAQLYSLATEFPKLLDRTDIGSLKLAAQLLADLERAFAPGQAATMPLVSRSAE
jgi:hypothetical protein